MWKNILIIFSVTFTMMKGVIYSNYKSTFYVPSPAHPVFTLIPATSIRLDSTTSVWKGGVHDDFQKWQNHHWTVSKWPIRNFFLTAIKSECLNQQFCFTLPFPALPTRLLPFLSPKGNILAWQPVQISEPFHLNAPQRSCLITAWISERKKERKIRTLDPGDVTVPHPPFCLSLPHCPLGKNREPSLTLTVKTPRDLGV